MIKKLFPISIFLGLTFFTACIEEVDFEVPNEFQNSTAIMGKIVKGNPSTVEVTVQSVFDFAFTGSSFINVQSLFIVDDRGNRLAIPFVSQGQYKLTIDPSMDFEVEIGRSYGVEVSLQRGQNFISELEELIPVPKMNGIEHRLVEKEIRNVENELELNTVVEYAINTSLIAEENQKRTSIKWDLERTYKQSDLIARDQCYVSGFDEPEVIKLFNIEGNSTTLLENYFLLDQFVTRIMVEGQYISVIQEALSEDVTRFYEQIKSLSTKSGTFYEPPPGQLISNFKKTNDVAGAVFGYFYATEHDTLHAFVDSTFINFYTPICPHPDYVQRENMDFGPCDDCCYCLWLDNSSTEKPSFWTN